MVIERYFRAPGVVTWTYVLLYGVSRFLLEFARTNERLASLGGVTLHQGLAGVMVIAGGFGLLSLARDNRKS